ncbi:hypothetical protein V6N13_056912 [Hibiscus sabdariffa]|uniref:Uncharacterized protein n=1 Tax=Hibiscus sabdariffa TaxID=183260 RepID=A0ABR2D2C5_9ROSI
MHIHQKLEKQVLSLSKGKSVCRRLSGDIDEQLHALLTEAGNAADEVARAGSDEIEGGGAAVVGVDRMIHITTVVVNFKYFAY